MVEKKNVTCDIYKVDFLNYSADLEELFFFRIIIVIQVHAT